MIYLTRRMRGELGVCVKDKEREKRESVWFYEVSLLSDVHDDGQDWKRSYQYGV